MKSLKAIFFALIFMFGCASLSINDAIKTSKDDLGSYQYSGLFDPVEMLKWKMIDYRMSQVQLFCFLKCPHPDIDMVFVVLNSSGLIESNPEFEREVQGWCYFLGSQYFSYAWDIKEQRYLRQKVSSEDQEEMRQFFDERRKEFKAMEESKIGAKHI